MRASNSHNNRALLLTGLFFLIFIAIIAKLYFVQVVKADALSQKGLDKRLREIPFQPKRGTIYDREGNELALTIETSKIIANPRIMPDPQAVAEDLAPIISTSEASIKKKFSSGSGYIVLKKLASKDVGIDVKKLMVSDLKKYNGLTIEETRKRLYPYGMIAGQVLGFADSNGQGISGIEMHYEGILKGSMGYLKTELDRSGRPIPNSIVDLKQTKDGSDLWLTIDKDIQQKAESQLDLVKKEFGYTRASIVVMDVKTGEVLAMAMRPGVDLNNFEKFKFSDLRNFVVEDIYEPGSTFKAVTAAAVLDEGLVNENSTFFLPSELRIGGYTIGEAHGRAAKTFTFPEIIARSSNVGAVKLSQLMSNKTFYSHIVDYGFGRRTGIDLPGEQPGILMNVANWEKTRGPTISFGQGISTNILQMASFYSAIANGGTTIRPHIIKEARDSEGKLIRVPQATADVASADVRVMSEDTAKRMRKVLEKNVEFGNGITSDMAQYTSGGKTGTAQKSGTNGGYGGKYISSFVGFAPQTDPRIVVAVVVDEPVKASYGNLVAAPSFAQVADYALKKLNVAPDKTASQDSGE